MSTEDRALTAREAAQRIQAIREHITTRPGLGSEDQATLTGARTALDAVAAILSRVPECTDVLTPPPAGQTNADVLPLRPHD